MILPDVAENIFATNYEQVYFWTIMTKTTFTQWKRVNNYLNNVSAHVRKDEYSQEVAKVGCY